LIDKEILSTVNFKKSFMKKIKIKRENPYSYSELNVLYNTKFLFFERDAAMFAKHHITSFDTAELQELSKSMMSILNDSEMVVRLKDATSAKNELIDELLSGMNFLRIGMRNAVSDNELLSLAPSIFKLSKQTDSQLLLSAGSALRVARQYFEVLLKWGVTTEFLAQFEILTDECQRKVFEIGVLKAERSNTTISRNQIANTAYKTMRRICRVGQMVWSFENDTAKYNDYSLPAVSRTQNTQSEAPEETLNTQIDILPE
jgi:hypothetical protein